MLVIFRQSTALCLQAVIADKQLRLLLREIEEECAERRGDAPAEPTPVSFLFEGQLSQNVRLTGHCPGLHAQSTASSC